MTEVPRKGGRTAKTQPLEHRLRRGRRRVSVQVPERSLVAAVQQAQPREQRQLPAGRVIGAQQRQQRRERGADAASDDQRGRAGHVRHAKGAAQPHAARGAAGYLGLSWRLERPLVFNFLVMIPLANLPGEATESLAFHTSETIGGLVNATFTFGNAVEVIVAIFTLKAGEINVVQGSLVGSVLSNLLRVLGCVYIAGGVCIKENSFNAVGASTNSSLLMLASFAMLLPSYIFYFSDHE
ncbi:hypothetical protein PR001_g6519 [Phytophthora rubi]|uniref:Sodium/calcium exchanger membrane region domain-containing protein n=1 Tax=Phytophthora rubi TaxID=129364 RepID=A0A6A3N7B2_9STRA|nr:hypothetical protein PR002_g6851 [Phytophthora rubi]KAE9041650.1 hypothetical protein PR001_g6519 [Phytophthora rubi]